MCYRTSNTATVAELKARYKATFSQPESYTPYFHQAAFSHPLFNILTSERPHEFSPYQWGLIPPWEKSYEHAASRMIQCANARGEEIAEKPSYRDAWKKNQRCIIPVTGFFESHTITKEKGKAESIPYYIEAGTKKIFSLGGLYNNWTDPTTGEIHPTFTILTVTANTLMKQVHNAKERMPLILSTEGERMWLDLGATLDEVKKEIIPYTAAELKAHPVSKSLHNPHFDANTAESLNAVQYDSLEGVIP